MVRAPQYRKPTAKEIDVFVCMVNGGRRDSLRTFVLAPSHSDVEWKRVARELYSGPAYLWLLRIV